MRRLSKEEMDFVKKHVYFICPSCTFLAYEYQHDSPPDNEILNKIINTPGLDRLLISDIPLNDFGEAVVYYDDILFMFTDDDDEEYFLMEKCGFGATGCSDGKKELLFHYKGKCPRCDNLGIDPEHIFPRPCNELL